MFSIFTHVTHAWATCGIFTKYVLLTTGFTQLFCSLYFKEECTGITEIMGSMEA